MIFAEDVIEIPGPDGYPMFVWYPYTPNSSFPTRNPTNIPSKTPTFTPTKSPTTTFPTNSPIMAWDKIKQNDGKNKQKPKKSSFSDTSSLENIDSDVIDVYDVNIRAPHLMHAAVTEFEQYIAHSQKYNLLIVHHKHTLKISEQYTHNVAQLHSPWDIVHDHFAFYLNEIKEANVITRDWCSSFLSSSILHLAYLNHTVFESIFNKLSHHKENKAYIASKIYYQSKRSTKYMTQNTIISNKAIGPMTNSTVLFIFDFFMHSFTVSYWEKFNDLMHTIYHSEYGKSKYIPNDLKNRDRWILFTQIAKRKLYHILSKYMSFLKNRYFKRSDIMITKSDLKLFENLSNELLIFCNSFHLIKSRIDIGRIIFNWRYIQQNHGSVAIISAVVCGPFEFKIFNALNYKNENIHQLLVNVKSTSKLKSATNWIINQIKNETNLSSKNNVKKSKKRTSNSASDGIIKYHFIHEQYMMTYDNKLVSNSNDLLLIRALMLDRLPTQYSKTKDGRYWKVKSLYDRNDLLYDQVAMLLDLMISDEWNNVIERFDGWIADTTGIFSEYFDADLFEGVYAKLDDMYPNKTEPMRTLMKFINNRYEASDYNLDNQHGFDILIKGKMYIHDYLFKDKNVISLLLDWFYMLLSIAFDMKLRSAMNIREIQRHNLTSEIQRLIPLTIDSFNEWLVFEQANNRFAYENARSLLKALNEFANWKTNLYITKHIYDWKFVDKLGHKDITVTLFDNDTRLLDETLNEMGYHKRKIKKFNVKCIQTAGENEEIKFKVQEII